MINIAIGYGFFLEMSLPEALTFIDKKTLQLQDRIAQLTTDACKVKGHIRLVLEVCCSLFVWLLLLFEPWRLKYVGHEKGHRGLEDWKDQSSGTWFLGEEKGVDHHGGGHRT